MTTQPNTTPKFDQSILDGLTTKSSKIRYLSSCKMSTGDISRVLGIRYQHVRNVLITPVKTPKV